MLGTWGMGHTDTNTALTVPNHGTPTRRQPEAKRMRRMITLNQQLTPAAEDFVQSLTCRAHNSNFSFGLLCDHSPHAHFHLCASISSAYGCTHQPYCCLSLAQRCTALSAV